MELKYRNYPHPVLDFYSDNFVGCSFTVSMAPRITRTAYLLDISAKTDCNDLRDLISNKKACFAIHVECSPTMYRTIFKSYEENFTIEIPANDVDGKVQVCPFIIASEDIDNYTNANFHPDFDGELFKVKMGDVLALDRDMDFDAMKETDILRNITSIFRISKAESNNAPSHTVDIEGELIYIYLSPKNHQLYTTLQVESSLQPILSSMIISPVLVHIIDIFKSTDFNITDFEERRWFRALRRRLKELGMEVENPESLEDSLVVAQKLIGDPITTALKSISEFSNDPE